MTFLAFLLALAQSLGFPGPGTPAASASAPITVVGGAALSGYSTGANVSVSYAPTAGNTLLVGVAADTGTSVSSMSASNSVALTQDSAGVVYSHRHVSWYRYTNVPAGITSVTIHTPGNAYVCASVVEVTGATTVDATDATGWEGYGVAWTTNTITTSAANAIVLAFATQFDNGYAFSVTGPATMVAQYGYGYGSCAVGYQIISSAGPYTISGGIAGTAVWDVRGIAYH